MHLRKRKRVREKKGKGKGKGGGGEESFFAYECIERKRKEKQWSYTSTYLVRGRRK